MSLSIYQDGTTEAKRLGDVNDIQTARLIVAQLVATTPSKDVTVFENSNNKVIEYKAKV